MPRDDRESWHDRPLPDLTTQFATDVRRGLLPQEVAARRQQWGPNEIRTGQAVSPLAILGGQFRSLVIWVLIGATLASAALGELADGLAILRAVSNAANLRKRASVVERLYRLLNATLVELCPP